MHGKNSNLLLFPVVGGNLAAAAVEDEAVGAVPVLNDVQPFLNLSPELQRMQKFTEEDRFNRLSQFS